MSKNNTTNKKDVIVRPRTAYNLFFKFTRLILVKQTSAIRETETENAHPNTSLFSYQPHIYGGKSHWSTMPGSIVKDWNYDHILPSDYDTLQEFLEQVLLVDEKTSGLNRKKSKPRVHRKTHGKIGFKSLCEVVSQRWKNTGSSVRQVFNKLAVKDRERYLIQKELYDKHGDRCFDDNCSYTYHEKPKPQQHMRVADTPSMPIIEPIHIMCTRTPSPCFTPPVDCYQTKGNMNQHDEYTRKILEQAMEVLRADSRQDFSSSYHHDVHESSSRTTKDLKETYYEDLSDTYGDLLNDDDFMTTLSLLATI